MKKIFSRAGSWLKRNIKPMDAYKTLKHFFEKDFVDDEINEITRLKNFKSTKNIIYERKHCIISKYCDDFKFDKEKMELFYGQKRYRLAPVNIDLSSSDDKNGDKNLYHFKANDGSLLYKIIDFKSDKKQKENDVIWIKGDKISEENKHCKGELVKESHEGVMETPFLLQSVNPVTKKTNVILTMLFFPFGFTAKALQYVGFYVPSLANKLIKIALKIVIYGGFFVFSAPFLFLKKIRDVNKNLFYHIIGKKEINIEQIKEQELAKHEKSLKTETDLSHPYKVIVIYNTISCFFDFVRNVIAYSINVVSVFLQASINFCNSIFYSSDEYRDAAKHQLKDSVSYLVKNVKNSFESTLKHGKELSEIKNIVKNEKITVNKIDSLNDDKDKYNDKDKYKDVKIDDLMKEVFDKEKVSDLGGVLKKEGVKSIGSKIFYSSKSPDFIPSIRRAISVPSAA